jgi:serine/threonine protein kinase
MAMSALRNLVGEVIGGRWVVEAPMGVGGTSTGGAFSKPYRVKEISTGRNAFLKVIDLVSALTNQYSGLPVHEAIRRVTDNHAFEVFLAETCRDKKMTRVVYALDSGEISIPVPALGNLQFPYIVFEHAEHGDVHTLLDVNQNLGVLWKLQVLHQVATAMQQLHAAEIAHQDVKRSNVVFFESNDGRLTDLGRAVMKNYPSRNDLRDVPCQNQNAAPELLYGRVSNEWGQRHLATDLYMLGNLAFTLFFNVTMTSSILGRLPPNILPFPNAVNYGNVLPALQAALDDILRDIEQQIPQTFRKQYIECLRLLCQPDPDLRGHPLDHAKASGNRYSVQRFISLFDLMRQREALKLMR